MEENEVPAEVNKELGPIANFGSHRRLTTSDSSISNLCSIQFYLLTVLNIVIRVGLVRKTADVKNPMISLVYHLNSHSLIPQDATNMRETEQLLPVQGVSLIPFH